MNNPRFTAKDRGLIKGAMRRAFSRSELHQQVLDEAAIEHSDPKRKRVKHWRRCNVCKQPEAKSNCVVDHISPVIPVNTTFADMSLDEAANRMWSEKSNLQCICETCHDKKSASEREERKRYKKQRNQK